jgi:hypothetical protein
MKKGVLIFIAGITLLSFVLVGFMGSVPTGSFRSSISVRFKFSISTGTPQS